MGKILSENKMQKDRVQLLNPVTKRWVKINTKLGGIVGYKDNPYIDTPHK